METKQSLDYLRIAQIAAALVISGWICLLCIAGKAYFFDTKLGIAELGQLGDTFGLLNALFTGLALTGLVYTVALQRDQTQAQQAQLQLQQEESSRQAREQFLTARLNAEIAVIQAKAAAYQLGFEGSELSQNIKRDAAVAELRNSQMRVEILQQEAKQGFSGGAWSPSVEKEAIRRYFVGILRWLVNCCDRPSEESSPQVFAHHVGAVTYQLGLLSEQVRVNYPDILSAIESVTHLFEREEANLKTAIDWCRAADSSFPSGQHPWV